MTIYDHIYIYIILYIYNIIYIILYIILYIYDPICIYIYTYNHIYIYIHIHVCSYLYILILIIDSIRYPEVLLSRSSPMLCQHLRRSPRCSRGTVSRVSSRRAASAEGLGAMGHGGNNVIPNVHFRRLAEFILFQYYPGRKHGGCGFSIFGTIDIVKTYFNP